MFAYASLHIENIGILKCRNPLSSPSLARQHACPFALSPTTFIFTLTFLLQLSLPCNPRSTRLRYPLFCHTMRAPMPMFLIFYLYTYARQNLFSLVLRFILHFFYTLVGFLSANLKLPRRIYINAYLVMNLLLLIKAGLNLKKKSISNSILRSIFK